MSAVILKEISQSDLFSPSLCENRTLHQSYKKSFSSSVINLKMDGWVVGWMDGWRNGRKGDGWLVGWMNECSSEFVLRCEHIGHGWGHLRQKHCCGTNWSLTPGRMWQAKLWIKALHVLFSFFFSFFFLRQMLKVWHRRQKKKDLAQNELEAPREGRQ